MRSQWILNANFLLLGFAFFFFFFFCSQEVHWKEMTM